MKLSRTSLRNYRSRAEATGMSMQELLNLSDVELQSIMQKGDGHRGRDTLRYNFMQEHIEEYALQYSFECSSLYSFHNILRVTCLLVNFSMKCGRGFKNTSILSSDKQDYLDVSVYLKRDHPILIIHLT